MQTYEPGQTQQQSSNPGLVVVTAGVSTPSSSRLLADLLVDETAGALAVSGAPVHPVVIELRDLFGDIAAAFGGSTSARLREALELVAAADALIVVTPVFAGSFSGMFKAFFDLLDPTAIANTPMIIGATGGTLRHALMLEHALRPLFSYLRAAVVPTSVFATSSDWASADSSRALHERARRAAGELVRAMSRTTVLAVTG